jgi:hypothetical protein
MFKWPYQYYKNAHKPYYQCLLFQLFFLLNSALYLIPRVLYRPVPATLRLREKEVYLWLRSLYRYFNKSLACLILLFVLSFVEARIRGEINKGCVWLAAGWQEGT